MCQLTFIDLGKYNDTMAKAIIKINSLAGHPDGWGMFVNRKTLFKGGENGILADLSNIEIDENPVIAHVRKTSTVNKTKGNKPENSHPFIENKLVLAHNGTLSGMEKEYPNIIDSQRFAKELSKFLRKSKKSFLEVFNEVNEKFTGKFAFLMYYGENYYIIRGNATLYKVKVTFPDESKGIIINTERESILAISTFLKSISGAEISAPELLKEETAFIYDEKEKDLKELGKVEVKTYTYQQTYYGYNHNKYTQNKDDSPNLFDLRIKLGLSPFEIQALFFILYMKHIFGATLNEKNEFSNLLNEFLNKFYSENKAKFWASLPYSVRERIHAKTFPYFMLTLTELKNLAEEYKK